jgi:hypothetical protein
MILAALRISPKVNAAHYPFLAVKRTFAGLSTEIIAQMILLPKATPLPHAFSPLPGVKLALRESGFDPKRPSASLTDGRSEADFNLFFGAPILTGYVLSCRAGIRHRNI